jgi:hypothetical protein
MYPSEKATWVCHLGIIGELAAINAADPSYVFPFINNLYLQVNSQVFGKGLRHFVLKTHRLIPVKIVTLSSIAGDNRYFSGFLDSFQGNKSVRIDNRAKHIIPVKYYSLPTKSQYQILF